MKKQYINPTVAIYAVKNAEILSGSTLSFGETETDGIANARRRGNNFNGFDDSDDEEE